MKKNVRVVVIVTICAILILGYYYYLSHRNVKDASSVGEEATKIETVLETDLEKNYPSTPREVIKLYNQILECYYNEKPSENEIKKLGEKQRMLLDDELLENNPLQTFYERIRSDINEYQADGRTISSASVCGTNEVIYKTIDNRECAYVTSIYYLKTDKSRDKTYQRYVLRKDSEGKWKILVYYMIANGSNE